MNEDQEKKPKLIIDEDWKSQVEEERARMQEQKESGESPSTASEAEAEKENVASEVPLPPASFPWLVTTLATQSLVALGQIPDPLENRPIVNLELAQHHIDMIAMLEEKTKGNLASDEAEMLDSVLHQLRMAFIAVKTHRASDQNAPK